MSTRSVSAEQTKAYLKKLGNPYASLSIQDEPTEATSGEPTMEQKRAYFRKLENPHAHSEIFGEPAEIQGLAEAKPAPLALSQRPSSQISKTRFQEGCRRIFLQYTPPDEGRVLRPQYRDFITRNKNRSSEQRFHLLEELVKYDISSSGNFRPHFNREQDLLTARKLQQIERIVDTVSTSK